MHNIRLRKNIQSLNAVPEEHRQAFREIKHIPEGKNEWENIKEMSIYLRKSNDSTSVCTINVPGTMKGGAPLKLQAIENTTLIFITRAYLNFSLYKTQTI